MCYDDDARPPLPPIRGGAADAGALTLISADGTPVPAYAARAEQPGGPGMVVLPDVRGLHPFYEELALRFAEAGVHAVAIDYFARTAEPWPRGPKFDVGPHVALPGMRRSTPTPGRPPHTCAQRPGARPSGSTPSASASAVGSARCRPRRAITSRA